MAKVIGCMENVSDIKKIVGRFADLLFQLA